MVGRRRTTPAFRPSAPAARSSAPSRNQTIALLTGVVLVAAAVAVASLLVKPSRARSFDLFYGSMFINDNTSPVAVDLASGRPTVGLHDAYTAVSAKTTADLDMIALGGSNTLMLNPTTGEFNLVDSTGFVAKPTDGGVPLPPGKGVTHTSAVAAGDSAYLLQSSDTGTAIYLVNAATVSSALGTKAAVKSRASRQINAPLAALSAPAAAANGDLWVLTDPSPQSTTAADRTHTLSQLSVPAGSNANAPLDNKRHGQIRGVAAVAAATRNGDGTGGDVPAVATSKDIRVFAGSQPITLPVHIDGTVTDILPASNAEGEFAFLYRTAAGWTEVRAPATAEHAASVHQLSAISPDESLVMPGASNGQLYTMGTSGAGNLWQIAADGAAQRIKGHETYPIRPGEKGSLAHSQVLARGDRVIFNARSNYEALVVFTDGSHAPRVLDKHSAVQIDPASATALADLRTKAATTTNKTAKPTKTTPKAQAQPINNKVNCDTATQTPNIPILAAGQRASRSIVLTWTYPLFETSDCVPSTYLVKVKVLTPGAPSTTGSVIVQGQNGVTLTGLFPATQYQMTVTAYINKHGTTSKPLDVSTGPEGPAAPTDVHATTTSNGDWTISWNSCGGVKQGCVQSTQWTIIPKFCDGRGLSNVPAPLSVVGDPTVHSFSQTYPGSDALLGRGLCFAVQGQSPQGTNGDVSEFTSAAYSWSPPIASDLHLTASQPGNTALGGSASTSVDLSLGSNPVRAVGGLGATVTFTLNGPGGARTKTVTFDGKSDTLSTSFPGIQAGAQYTAQATVQAPNHPTATATTPTVTVTTRANWPDLSANANCPNGGGLVVLSCTLTVNINGISSAAAGGETFSLTDKSGISCGNTFKSLSKNDFDPAHDAITDDINYISDGLSGSCTVTLALTEGSNQRNPAVFGGTTSPTFSTSVNLGQASTLGASGSDFSGKFVDDNGAAAVSIHYSGDQNAANQLTSDWHEQVNDPAGDSCGSDSRQPDVTVDVTGSCVLDQGDTTGWTFTISYRDRRDGTQHVFNNISVPGTPPDYVPPCSVATGDFSASWNQDASAPAATITFAKSGADDLRGCSKFVETLQDPTGATCGTPTTATDPGDPPPDSTTWDATNCDSTSLTLPGWTVQISYESERDGSQTKTVLIADTPPHN